MAHRFDRSGVHSVVPARSGARVDSRLVQLCRHVGDVHFFEVRGRGERDIQTILLAAACRLAVDIHDGKRFENW